MITNRLTGKARSRTDDLREIARAQNAASDVAQLNARELPFTVGDVISRFEALERREPQGSPLTPTLRTYGDVFRSVVARDASESGTVGTSRRLVDLVRLESAPPILAVQQAMHLCLADWYAKSEIGIHRAAGRALERENLTILRLEGRERVVNAERRRSYIGGLASHEEAHEAVRALLERAIRCDANADVSTLRDVLDEIQTHCFRIGYDAGESFAIHGERALLAAKDDLIGRYGRLLVDGVRRTSPGTAFEQDHQRASLPATLAEKQKKERIFKENYVALLEQPSLEAWRRFTALVERHTVESIVTGHVHGLALGSIMLDPASKMFGFFMERIAESQLRIAEERARSAAAARELEALDLPAAGGRSARKPSRRANRETPRAKITGPSVFDEPEELQPAALRRRIYAAVASRRAPVALEGDVAKNVLENLSAFASIVGFNEVIARDARTTHGELDLHLDTAIVECTLKRHGKEAQLMKYLDDPLMNPKKKAVVLYGANYAGNVPAGVLHVRDPEELADILFGINRARARRPGTT